jgi:hypothetical protein
MALKRKIGAARAVPDTRQPALAPSPTPHLCRAPILRRTGPRSPFAARDLELLAKAMGTGGDDVVDVQGATRKAATKLGQQGFKGVF